MAAEFVQPYRETLEFVFAHYEKFADICPDAIWNETFGGWPVGEQYWHAINATAMLLESVGGIKTENPLPDAGNLDRHDLAAPDRQMAREFLLKVRDTARKTLDSLTDAELLQKNEMITQRFGRPVTNGVVLNLASGHLQYHLGSCDAALRNSGKEGAW